MPITLELKAKHFKDTRFASNDACAMAKAYTELTGHRCHMKTYQVSNEENGNIYSFEDYLRDDFDKDLQTARSNKFDDTVIRTIELVEDEEEIF